MPNDTEKVRLKRQKHLAVSSAAKEIVAATK